MNCRALMQALCCLALTFLGTACGSSNSSSPNSAPAITVQPSNVTVAVGQTATFSVQAAGSGTLAYQWQKSNTAISGSNSSSYTTSPTTTADTRSSP